MLTHEQEGRHNINNNEHQTLECILSNDFFLFSFFTFSILLCSGNGNEPYTKLANFGSQIFIQIHEFKHPNLNM